MVSQDDSLPAATPLTRLLIEWREGDRDAFDRLIPLVYHELRRLASSHLRRSSARETLAPTDLVHEAYLRLVQQAGSGIQSRTHFYALAAHIMRCVLVDRARRRGAAKREGGRIRVGAEELDGVSSQNDLDVIAVDDALTSLAAIDPVKSQIVELRFFGGLPVDDVAEVMGMSGRSVARQWVMAKAWLYSEIQRGTGC